MKIQRVNSNNVNPMQLNTMSSMAGMMNLIQKIGKGKRKYSVKLEKQSKKMLSKFVDEMKRQMMGANGMANVSSFLDYVKKEAESKSTTELKLSYEEQEFLIRAFSDSLKGMSTIKYKWYQIFKKLILKVMMKQYTQLLIQLKK